RLLARRIGVGAELRARRRACARIPLPVDAVSAAILPVGLPHDDEARPAACDPGEQLARIRGVTVDAELTRGDPCGGVPLAPDVVVAVDAGLTIARPGDDEVPRGVRGDGRILLIARRVGVDLELRPYRGPGVVVALAVDAEEGTVLEPALPDD